MNFRPPAVPLVTHDPYFSVWSTSDQLNGGTTRHWTGKEQPLRSEIFVDGKSFTLMGEPNADAPALPQVSLVVLPTRTIYEFGNDEIHVRLTFCSPLLVDDLDVFSRPATYLVWDVKSADGKRHAVKAAFSASGSLAVNEPQDQVDFGKNWIGAKFQDVLGRSGDDLRIEWGRLYLANPSGEVGVGSSHAAGPEGDGSEAQQVALKTEFDFGDVSQGSVTRHAILAYDDDYSIQFFGQNLRAWWKRDGMSADAMLANAERDYGALLQKCTQFDDRLMSDMAKAGGTTYAQLGALAYRQSFAAQKLVADKNGQPLMFSKENFSNGCIGTVDVLYPAAPQMLLFSPTLMKASLVPILEYAASPRWNFPFAPHDLGTYPLANGQVYGGGERTEDNQMPVEESGNMLILLAALAHIEGNASFSARYWPQLSRWAAYLADKGFDPESQLSTDDFAGHLAHNVNLSAKAIEALAAYADLAQRLGKTEESKKYRALAQQFSARWQSEAKGRLAFDKPDSWSQKYNLVWDKILGYHLFPESVIANELATYRTKMNAYGLPLDSRRDYTKLDWTVWTATLAPTQAEFEALVDPILKYLNETPDRNPMSDWYHTETPRQAGFQARSVVGGVFIKILADPSTWTRYASADKARPANWAPIPKPPIIHEVVPTSQATGIEWAYTTELPQLNWYWSNYDDSSWKRGLGGFGTEATPGAVVRTKWDSSDIWIRRTFQLPADLDYRQLRLYIHHDEDAQVFINGVLVAKLSGYSAAYGAVTLSPEAIGALRAGANVIAIHCHQTTGGQYIDAGLVTVKAAE